MILCRCQVLCKSTALDRIAGNENIGISLETLPNILKNAGSDDKPRFER
jgi:hypothetical protein